MLEILEIEVRTIYVKGHHHHQGYTLGLEVNLSFKNPSM